MDLEDPKSTKHESSTVRLTFDQLRQTLRRFKYFRHWTDEQVKECSIMARVVQYAPYQLIPLDLPLPFAYLILSGQCMIIQCLQLVRDAGQLSEDNVRLATFEEEDLDPQREEAAMNQLEQIHNWHAAFAAQISYTADIHDSSLQYDKDKAISFIKTPTQEECTFYRFLDVGTLRCGAVFGLGESHHHRSIVARTRTQCLLIPRCWLFLKPQNVGNTWQRLCMYLDWAIPCREELYDRSVQDRAWLRYRKRLMRAANKRPSGTVTADIPIMCRIAQTGTSEELEREKSSGLKASI